MFKNKTIAVTGAAGFIASHLVEALLQREARVIGIDNFDSFYPRSVKEENLQHFVSHPRFSFYETDIRNYDEMKKMFNGNSVDIVVHLAAKAGVRPSLENPNDYYQTNVTGTLNLLEAMRSNKIKKLVFASSSSVYGNNKKVPFSEADPVDLPISPYAATKKAGELLCHTYHHLYGFDVSCLRFFTVYGARQRPDLAIHQFTRNIYNNRPISVFGEGNTFRDYTYIEDILSGVLEAIARLNGYEIINLGESRTVALSELIGLIENALGKKAVIEKKPLQPGDMIITNADISKAKRLLGYSPCTDITVGIPKFVEWFLRENSSH